MHGCEQPLKPEKLTTLNATSLMTNKDHAFWLLNIMGWAGYGIILAGTGFLWHKGDMFQLVQVPYSVSTGFLAGLIMRFFLQRIWLLSGVKKFALMFLLAALFTALWVVVLMHGYKNICDEDMAFDIYTFIGWYKYHFFVILSWVALYAGIKYYWMYQEEHSRSLHAQAMATEAQLKMLRYQLNPHFLFNTLNAISTLVLEKQVKPANAMLTELSKFLRYSLETDPMQKVSLAQEVNALTLYLNIEKVRFEERLGIHMNVSDDAKTALVPSLLLQPLIENSIKHAISKSERGGNITLNAQVFAGELLIEIIDDGPGIQAQEKDDDSRTGVGLVNFRKRLETLYGSDQSCSFESAQPDGLKINIRLPYENAAGEE